MHLLSLEGNFSEVKNLYYATKKIAQENPSLVESGLDVPLLLQNVIEKTNAAGHPLIALEFYFREYLSFSGVEIPELTEEIFAKIRKFRGQPNFGHAVYLRALGAIENHLGAPFVRDTNSPNEYLALYEDIQEQYKSDFETKTELMSGTFIVLQIWKSHLERKLKVQSEELSRAEMYNSGSSDLVNSTYLIPETVKKFFEKNPSQIQTMKLHLIFRSLEKFGCFVECVQLILYTKRYKKNKGNIDIFWLVFFWLVFLSLEFLS